MSELDPVPVALDMAHPPDAYDVALESLRVDMDAVSGGRTKLLDRLCEKYTLGATHGERLAGLESVDVLDLIGQLSERLRTLEKVRRMLEERAAAARKAEGR